MKRYIFITLGIVFCSLTAKGQILLDSTLNSSTKKVLLAAPNTFAIGSYGEAHYNQKIDEGKFKNGKVDLHRIILFMGYKFNNNLQFFSEIEFEHVKEVYVEQAFLNYRFNSAFNLKGGIILIPMGVVNEFHEPTLFNGVERTEIDQYVIPSTWREMGFGSHGIIKRARIQYQLYAVNGFVGYNGTAKFNGKNGLRSGRQSAAEAILRKPSFTGKVIFFGINGLKVGASGYVGTSESTLYEGVDRDDAETIKIADSSSVGISMASVNLQYTLGDLSFTGVGAYTTLSNTEAYNTFTSSNVGKEIMGYYAELAYRVRLKKGSDYPRLVPFVRYENYDTHLSVDNSIDRNKFYHRETLTGGLGYHITPGAILKADYQWLKTEGNPKPTNVFNLGFGFWF